MKRKRDKKYLLTLGTCIILGIFMLISLINKETFSYLDEASLIECMSVVSPDGMSCCDSVSSFSNQILYNDEEQASDECFNYTLINRYSNYECIVNKIQDKYQWKLNIYNGCR